MYVFGRLSKRRGENKRRRRLYSICLHIFVGRGSAPPSPSPPPGFSFLAFLVNFTINYLNAFDSAFLPFSLASTRRNRVISASVHRLIDYFRKIVREKLTLLVCFSFLTQYILTIRNKTVSNNRDRLFRTSLEKFSFWTNLDEISNNFDRRYRLF